MAETTVRYFLTEEKSQSYFSGVSAEVQQAIASELGFVIGKLPVKYLGVPLISSRLSHEDCAPIIDKINAKIASWANRYLSFAGRLQLINSVIFHMHMCWCSIFILPRKIMVMIERMCRNFLWTGQWSEKGMPTVAWKDICLPKREGGLGIKQIDASNTVAIGKYLWRSHTNATDVWVTWEKMRLKGVCIWAANTPQDCAWTWCKILCIRDQVKEYMSIQISDGRQCSLFYDRWLPEGRLCDRIDFSPWQHHRRVSQWIVEGRWKIPNSFVKCHPLIAMEIQQINISATNDSPLWTGMEKPYSIADCYNLLWNGGNRVS